MVNFFAENLTVTEFEYQYTNMNGKNDKFHRVCVGVLYWTENHGLTRITSSGLRELGFNVVDFYIGEELPNYLDIVFVIGPFGSMVPIVNHLKNKNASSHPPLLFHHTEPFPNPALPEWIRSSIALARSRLERMVSRLSGNAQYSKFPHLCWLTSKAFRFRYYGDLHWIKQAGLKYLLSVDSPLTEDFFRERGFNVIYPNGFWFPNQPVWGADLALNRDISVLWMGKHGSSRRKKILQRIRKELRDRNVEILFIDGVENPYVFGEQRTQLLNRTKIVLNLVRQEWDNNAMRFYLAALNRAMIISETMLPHNPAFISGKHLIEVPINQLADTICYYLSNESDRQRISNEAYKLVSEEITLQGTLGRILDTAFEQELI